MAENEKKNIQILPTFCQWKAKDYIGFSVCHHNTNTVSQYLPIYLIYIYQFYLHLMK